MTSHVLISSDSGSGQVRDEVVLSGAVRLLRRRTAAAIAGLSLDLPASSRAHPDIDFVAEDAALAAFAGCELLCIVGNLQPGGGLERAARHLLLAKLTGVPVALVAVRVESGTEAEALLGDVLLQAESVSACEAGVAQRLGARRGRRVETVAPLEFLADLGNAAPSDEARIGICAELLAGATPAEVEALGAALVQVAEAGEAKAVLVVGPGQGSALRLPGCETHASRTWLEWAQALAGCAVLVSRGGDPALGLAARYGTVPVALLAPGGTSELHLRLGFERFALPGTATAPVLVDALQEARQFDRQTMRERGAPLEVLSWRALGPLAEAGRSQALCTDGWQAASRRALVAALRLQVAPVLAAGDAAGAESALEAWRETLAREPLWAEARARTWALLGRDAAACATLESALAEPPDNAACRQDLARTLSRQGDHDGARRVWEEIAARAPRDAEPIFQLGCLELLRGCEQAALALWAEALQRNPSHAATSRAVRQCLDDDAAVEVSFWEDLCRQHSGVADFWFSLGVAAGRAGDWDQAESSLAHAAALSPGSSEISQALGVALDRRAATAEPAVLTR